MSELSTVAIKDGHRGHPHHLHSHALNADLRGPSGGLTPFARSDADAERADRISRLAGLERLGAVRTSSSASLPPGASANNPSGLNHFESAYMIPPGAHVLPKERSTVGSASATTASHGDAGDSGSAYTYDDKDKMSESQEHDEHEMMEETSSMGGMSDENASLVGFGEGAGSTVSGPVSSVAASMGSRMPTPSQSHVGRTIGGHGSGQPREDVQMIE